MAQELAETSLTIRPVAAAAAVGISWVGAAAMGMLAHGMLAEAEAVPAM